MRPILFISLLLLSPPSFAVGLIPYEIDVAEVDHCISGFEPNGKEPSLGLFPWSKKESGVDSFIAVVNTDNKVLYRFGNSKGQSFETREEKATALEKLIDDGVCPQDTVL